MKTQYRIKEINNGIMSIFNSALDRDFIIQQKILGLFWYKAFNNIFDTYESAEENLKYIDLNDF